MLLFCQAKYPLFSLRSILNTFMVKIKPENTICCIFNYAPHYREPIYTAMDEELECDFYFGDDLLEPIKPMDVSKLNGFKKQLKNKSFKIGRLPFTWQKGVLTLFFKKYKYYLVTGEPGSLSTWLLLLLSKLSNKKVYVWSHGLTKLPVSKGDYFQKTFFQLCDKIFLYGEKARDVMLSSGFSQEQLIPIYNSLNHGCQLKVREKLTHNGIYQDYFGNNNPVIIYIGRVQKVKKLDILIKAVSNLHEKGEACNLVIVGGITDAHDIKKIVSDQKLEQLVWFYGPCYDENKIGELLSQATVCVSPGPVGLTALHSMTYGCPVISNDDFTSQMPEHEIILPGITGDFFIQNNSKSLVETISRWLHKSPKERRAIQKSCNNIVDSKWNPGNQIRIFKQELK